MKEIGNQASRIYDILSQVSAMEDSVTLQQAWSKVFEYKPGDLERISYVPSILIEMLKNIEDQLGKVKHIQNHNIYFKTLRTIRNCIFNSHYTHKVIDFKKQINNHLPGLSVCSDILDSNNLNEKIISKEEIHELQRKADELIQEILSSEIHDDVKIIFVDIISQFKNAAILYELKGVSALKEAFSKGVGDFVINAKTINSYDGKSNEKTLAYKVLTYMEKINTVVGFVTNTQIAIPYITELIKN